MIIVGGYNSSNTTNLARISRKFLPERTHHIDSVSLIQEEWIRDIRTLGIGAGTSTPKSQIQAVQRKIGELAGGNVHYVREDRDGELVKDDFGEDVEI
jgi:4-hydroxy-3-methylbut-2-enyl diphosphate reductase